MVYIGIDPGTKTGLAVWDSKRKCFLTIVTLPIHQALDIVSLLYLQEREVAVIFEDARKRTWFGKGDISAKKQGAGSIKRDCAIWEDFCEDKNIPYQAVPPQRGGTKLSPDYFRAVTGWGEKTSNHARDAAMLVFGR